MEKFFIILLTLIFIFSFLISIYHFGIEQGFFQESSVCGLRNATEILSKEELLKQLNERTISCKDVTFRIFGLSLTSINIFISLIIIIILTKAYISYEKIKP
jgi:disulfide bond formation protein DsbB|tara:strand:- start:169 stop:474 length:306 start_codon:yes stop_codon:yes gene_type:complete